MTDGPPLSWLTRVAPAFYQIDLWPGFPSFYIWSVHIPVTELPPCPDGTRADEAPFFFNNLPVPPDTSPSPFLIPVVVVLAVPHRSVINLTCQPHSTSTPGGFRWGHWQKWRFTDTPLMPSLSWPLHSYLNLLCVCLDIQSAILLLPGGKFMKNLGLRFH